MNRRFLLLFAVLLIAFAANANPVDKVNAEKIGRKFLKTNNLHLAKTYNLKNGDAAFYVFNKADGFVIVAADDRAMPILAYSNEGSFDENDVPEQLRYYLDRFVAQIQYGIDNQIVANEFTSMQWKNVMETGYLDGQKGSAVVGPLLTSTWNQNYPYNRLCPSAPGGPGNHAYAGCVAVAMGQIMRFWGYPVTGQGSHGGVNFGNTTYAWSQMLDAIPNDPDVSDITPIATLLWHCGVSVDMEYSASGSGADVADVPNALVTYFKYSENMQHEYKECEGDVYYTDSQWISKIKNCLGNGRPILYGAADDNIGMGHAFVCDGYDSDDLLHFNWGWSGSGNGYFSLGALNVTSATGYNYYFNTCNSAIFNIHPQNISESYEINATAYPAEGGYVLGAGTFDEGDICTLTAQADMNSYSFLNWTEDGQVVSTDNPYRFSVDGNRNLVANFIEKHFVTDYHQYPDNMNAISVVFIDGVEQASPLLEVGAFCDDESRGSEIPTHINMNNQAIDNWMYFLVIPGQNGDDLTFRLYDHETQQELDLQCVTSIEWNEEAGYNYNLSKPLEIHFVSGITQTTELSAGWNWFSYYIAFDDPIEALLALETSLGENALQIASADFITEYDDEEWEGLLDDVGIDNAQMYLILATNDCTVELQGTPVNPGDYEITINPGWNWIGFPSAEEIDINVALAGFEAEVGDQISGTDGFTEYDDGEWEGILETFVPGNGYLYYSASEVVKTLVIQTSQVSK